MNLRPISNRLRHSGKTRFIPVRWHFHSQERGGWDIAPAGRIRLGPCRRHRSFVPAGTKLPNKLNRQDAKHAKEGDKSACIFPWRPLRSWRLLILLGALRHIENPFDVAAQHSAAEVDGLLFAPAAVDDEPLGQNLRQDPLVHRELRQARTPACRRRCSSAICLVCGTASSRAAASCSM